MTELLKSRHNEIPEYTKEESLSEHSLKSA